MELINKITYKCKILLEQLRGVDFIKFEDNAQISVPISQGNHYSATDSVYLKNVLDSLNIHESSSIIDIGSGKGFAMSIMHHYGFFQVHGIEISEKLFNISIQNFCKLKIKENTKVFHSSAENFLDYSTYNYIYLYNPFPKEIAQIVINNIANSCKKDVVIIYKNPIHSDLFLNNGFKITKEYNFNGHNLFYIINKNNE